MTISVPREWDAQAYDQLPLPHLRWGRGVRADAAVADRLDQPVVDYVRLQFSARRR